MLGFRGNFGQRARPRPTKRSHYGKIESKAFYGENAQKIYYHLTLRKNRPKRSVRAGHYTILCRICQEKFYSQIAQKNVPQWGTLFRRKICPQFRRIHRGQYPPRKNGHFCGKPWDTGESVPHAERIPHPPQGTFRKSGFCESQPGEY